MAIMVLINADGVSKEIYEQLRKEVNWEGNPPQGGMLYAAGIGNKGMRVVDIWSSAQEFNNFINKRLKPALEKRNAPLPQPEIIQIHNINYFPGLAKYKR